MLIASCLRRLAVAAFVSAALPLALAPGAMAGRTTTADETAVDATVDPSVTAALADRATERVLVVSRGADPVDAAAAAERTLDGTDSSVTLQSTTMPVVGTRSTSPPSSSSTADRLNAMWKLIPI